jgi:hypothetical protein
MKQSLLSKAETTALRARFAHCQQQLATLDLISQGSVTESRPGAYRWTRKVRAKTVTVTLSPEQAQAFRLAIGQHRLLEKLIDEMRALSQKILLESLPTPRRRKRALHPKPSLS